MDRQILELMLSHSPATVAIHAILERLLPAEGLDDFFAKNAQLQYHRHLLFSQLVALVTEVVLGEQPSVHAAFRRHAPDLNVSLKSVYNKLNHLELGLVATLLDRSAQTAHGLLQRMGALESPWLPDYRVRILDGNALSATDRRLLELRPFWDAPLPGKVLAVLEQESGLVHHLFPTPDGHAQERSLLPEVIELIRAKDLWIADRNFCTHQFLHEIDSRDGFFVIRRHGTVEGHHPGPWSAEDACPTGRVREQTLEIHREQAVKTFRRIRVELNEPTRNGDEWIEILTNLPAEVDRSVVVSLYQRRWRIETLFWEMAETLQCEPTTLCQPQGFLFVFGMGFVASNAVRVFRGAIRHVHGAGVWETLSLYYLMWEVVRFSGTMEICRDTASWQEWHQRNEDVWLAELLAVVGRVNPEHYRKAPKRSPPPKTKRGKYRRAAHKNGGHTSTHKVLEARKAKEN